MKRVEFSGSTGETLSARLDLPPNEKPHAYALFAHCFTCNKNLGAVRNISRALTSEGFAVLRFDFTGLGESEGEFADTSFSHNVQDLLNAAEHLGKTAKAPELIIGHSLGGAAAVFAATQIESVKAVVTIGAPSNPVHVQHLFSSDINQIEATGKATVDLGGRQFTIKKQFLEDLRDKNMAQVVANLRKPILVMHSPQDTTVGIENAAEIYQAAWHPKSFISLDGADHLLSQKDDSMYAGNVIAAWSGRYIDTVQQQVIETAHQAVAQIDDDEGYTTQIQLGNHKLLADEPPSVGGLDLGPSPYELVSAGLAACTAMTMKMYAQRKSWPLKEARVHVQHGRKHADDCEDCDEPGNRIDHFEKLIELVGDLDDAQRSRLMEIAEKCPVNKTLTSQIRTSANLLP